MSEKIFIAVHVTPRSGRDEVMGVKMLDATAGGRAGSGLTGSGAAGLGVRAASGVSNASAALPEVQVRVTAPPDGGKANKAVCKLVAASLGVPKTTVEVAGGATSRHKRLSVVVSQERLNGWLTSLPQL